jgi:saccharopine dehydrogenase-like NADP-dependent oxidoreductase
VVVRGTKGGERKTLCYEMAEAFDHDTNTSAMKHATSAATSAAALTLARGELKGGGAAPPEHVVDKAAYLDQVRERGLTLHEQTYDGWRDVRDPSQTL